LTIRVSIQQPALPAYRIPVFRELAARAGFDLTVCYASHPNLANAAPDGFRAEEIGRFTIGSGRLAVFFFPALPRLARASVSDVLVASWNSRSVLLRPALERAKRGGVGTVLWGHGFSKRESPKRLAMRDALALRADSVVFYNNQAADAFRERNPDHADRGAGVFVAINSLDQSEIQAAREDWLTRPDDLASFRGEHGLPEPGAGPVAIFVSRLLEENRVDLLLKATARIPGLTTVVIGKGPRPAPPRVDRGAGSASPIACASRARSTGSPRSRPGSSPPRSSSTPSTSGSAPCTPWATACPS
jgi:glycosyltransferase involved in cell wall biosynthesis